MLEKNKQILSLNKKVTNQANSLQNNYKKTLLGLHYFENECKICE